MNEAHAEQVLAEYQEHYHRHRPHGSRDQRPPTFTSNPVPSGTWDLGARRLVRTRILAGVINKYRYVS